jgi:hypothetical protein
MTDTGNSNLPLNDDSPMHNDFSLGGILFDGIEIPLPPKNQNQIDTNRFDKSNELAPLPLTMINLYETKPDNSLG